MRYIINRDWPMLYDFDNLFNDFFFSGTDRFPPVDVYETEKEYVIEAEVPGYKEDDIHIYCKNKVLTISSKMVEKEKGRYRMQEIALPEFKRSFTLPEDADEENVNASSTNGILTITISKKAKEEPKRIEVKIN